MNSDEEGVWTFELTLWGEDEVERTYLFDRTYALMLYDDLGEALAMEPKDAR